jgi:hypothetical protein
MKTKNILHSMLAGALLFVLAACSKGGDDFLYKGDMLAVTIKGYNGASEDLIVKIDTLKFKFDLYAMSTINLSDAYTFPADKEKTTLTITEKNSGKLVLQKEVSKDDGPITINLLYLNGKVTEMPKLPPVEDGKVKMHYMFAPTVTNYTGLVDIVLYKYYTTSLIWEEVTRMNNVKPNEFTTEPITYPTFTTGVGEYFGVRQGRNLYVRIYKAGTSEYYTQGTGYTWHVTSSSPGKSAASTASSTLYIVGENPSGTEMRFRTILTQ